MKVRLEVKQELDITFIMQAGAWGHPSTNISFFWNNVFLKFRLKPARFQCELQQRSLIVQPSSRGFKDQQVLPPAQRAPASRSCRSVVQLSLLNHACVSQTRHQQGLDQRCGHMCECVCVFPMCRLFTDSRCRRWGHMTENRWHCGAPPTPPNPPPTETWKRKHTPVCTLRTCTTWLELHTYTCKLSKTHTRYNFLSCNQILTFVLLRSISLDSTFTQRLSPTEEDKGHEKRKKKDRHFFSKFPIWE